MKDGTYKRSKFDLYDYKSPFFYSKSNFKRKTWEIPTYVQSCGGFALYGLIQDYSKCHFLQNKMGLNVFKQTMPRWKMVQCLVYCGYYVFELTKAGVTNNWDVCNEIRKEHVLLTNQRFMKIENSWQIIYNNKAWHNGEIESLNPLEFVNRPIEGIYVIWHPDWSDNKPTLPKEYWNVI